MSNLFALCWFLCFLLHVLCKAAALSAPQAVQQETRASEGGSMWEKRGGTKGEGRRKEGGRMMGQVWNLHTLLVAHTAGIFTSVWWVTHLVLEVRENVGLWTSRRHKLECKGIACLQDESLFIVRYSPRNFVLSFHSKVYFVCAQGSFVWENKAYGQGWWDEGVKAEKRKETRWGQELRGEKNI